MRNIFPEKSYTNSDGETSPRLFSKKLKLSISWSNSPKLIEFAFIVCTNRGLSKYVEIKMQTTCFYLIMLFENRYRYRTSLATFFPE